VRAGISLQLGPRHVVSPDRVEWTVGRRWVSRRFDWNWRRYRGVGSDGLIEAGFGAPDFSGLDFGQGLLLVAGVLAVILVLIPLLFFGVELIVFGVLVAVGLMARVISGKPWVVEARASTPHRSDRLEWQVRGWRKSGRLIGQVASDLAAGRDPTRHQLPE